MRVPFAAITTLMLVAAATQARAQDVTLLLKSGQRADGELASFDQSTLDLRSGGSRRSLSWSDVVLMDFVGGASGLPATEADAARRAEQTIVLKGGESLRGKVLDFVDEGSLTAAVVFAPTGQGQRRIQLDKVGRIYVSAFSSEALAAAGLNNASAATPPPVSSSTQAPARPGSQSVVVAANARWVGTGVFVANGQQVGFESSGTVFLRSELQEEARPAGASSGRLAPAGAPLPGILVGALVGRVGSGRPFGIGNQASVAMPGAGELFLAVNDDEVSDNQGAFTVSITLATLPRRR